MDLNEIRERVESFILEAGKKALIKWEDIGIELHSDGVDVTTTTDREIETDFYNFVCKNFPDHGFIGEEFKEFNKEGEYQWVIDPIDGTKYYAKSIPLWTINIALLKDKEPVIGFTYDAISDQLYYAVKGMGAFLNGKQIHISEETNLRKLLINLDIPLSIETDIDMMKTVSHPIFSKLYFNVYRIRLMGNQALCWLAQGFFGAYLTILPSSHIDSQKDLVDSAAGIIIAQESGAAYKRYSIENEYGKVDVIIVARQEVMDEILALIA